MSQHGITVVRIEKNKSELVEGRETKPAGAYRFGTAAVQGLQLAPRRTRPGRAQTFLLLFILLILLGPQDILSRLFIGIPTLELDDLSRVRYTAPVGPRLRTVVRSAHAHSHSNPRSVDMYIHCVTWLR
jgi:hypothetical protein